MAKPRTQPALSDIENAEFDELRTAERKKIDQDTRAARLLRESKIELRDVSPYGTDSPHSWTIDMAVNADQGIIDPLARERLNRFRSWREKQGKETRAVSSTTLGGLIPATIPPYVAEAIAYGLRSTAPLALALLRLDLPDVGTTVDWAKVTTPATVGVQTAENTAVPQSSDEVVASATDPIKTIAGFIDFSAQASEMSGSWFDSVIGEELGRALGAKLEQQIWNGSGSSGQLVGFAVMAGNSSSTVSGQTMPLFMNKVYDQMQQVATNLGSPADLIALSPRRYSAIGAATAALGLDATDVLPDELQLVVSPAAPLTLGGGTEDWGLILNRAAVPLVRDAEPTLLFQKQGPSAGTNLTFRWVIYSYVALGVSRRPEGVGIVKGATTPTFT